MKLIAVLLALALSACAAPLAADNHLQCLSLYNGFADASEEAAQSRRGGELLQALYHQNAAQMNLDALLARGCCRHEDTCPAVIFS